MNEEGSHIPGKLGGVYYRQGKRGIFQVSFQDDRGQEVRKSTRTTDEAKAAKFLEAERRRVIKCQENGEIYEAPRLRKQTISECLDQWERQCRLHSRWNDTLVCDKRQLLERFGSMTADSLTKSVFQAYQVEQKQNLTERKSLGRNSKLNRHLVILNASMKLAGITPSYAKQMKDLKLPEPPARQGYFTPAEFRLLLSALPPHLQDAIEACWLTGWRVSEVCGKVILGKFRPGVLWSEMEANSLLLPAERNKGLFGFDKAIPCYPSRKARYLRASRQNADL